MSSTAASGSFSSTGLKTWPGAAGWPASSLIDPTGTREVGRLGNQLRSAGARRTGVDEPPNRVLKKGPPRG